MPCGMYDYHNYYAINCFLYITSVKHEWITANFLMHIQIHVFLVCLYKTEYVTSIILASFFFMHAGIRITSYVHSLLLHVSLCVHFTFDYT